MRGLKKSALPMFFTFVSFVFLGRSVHAFTPIEVSKFKLDPKVVSCMVISQNLEKRATGFETVRTSHVEIYTRLMDRITQMIEKWESWGYNSEKVGEDLEALEEKVDEYKEDFADLLTKLDGAKEACGAADFSAKVSQAKEALKEVRKDVVDIRVFYQTELRKDILEMKEQKD